MTMEIPQYKLGCGGEVVSKQQLKVNFARNDIQHDCPIWKVVKKFVGLQQKGDLKAAIDEVLVS